jgi:uncharacterized protein (TIGR03790 family)
LLCIFYRAFESVIYLDILAYRIVTDEVKIESKETSGNRVGIPSAFQKISFMASVIILFFLIYCQTSSALEPNEILIIANQDIPESMRVAQYYCKHRQVPQNNILALSLGTSLKDSINRENYEKQLAEPIRQTFLERKLQGKIKCLLTVYGVPLKVGPRGVLKEQTENLKELQELIDTQQKKVDEFKQYKMTNTTDYKVSDQKLTELKSAADRINGKETHASVDSELSMVLFKSYELYRWQLNPLNKDFNDYLNFRSMILMVSRLDGPSDTIAEGLVDKAISAEKTGLKGTAYIDSRGIRGDNEYAKYDQSLRELAIFTRSKTNIPVVEEQTSQLFEPNSCPQTALYCGWYSVRKYIDAFDFVDGAIGYHIASFEATNLRDPNSSEWCPAMLRDGITATLGPVAEPYLHTFPHPKAFFEELYKGSCLVEAYYHTKPFNSWQLLLIGDPLYQPFKKSPLK